jgi:hypothetical protein
VPPFLRSLEPLLNSAVLINRYCWIILPALIFALVVLGFIQIREGKRGASKDDWLIDS